MEGVAYEQFLKLERDHWWFVGRRRSYYTILEHWLPAKRGLTILDVGCGVGCMLPDLSRLGAPVAIALFPKPDDTRTNLGHSPAAPINALLAAIFGGEGKVLKTVSAPFGHSLVLVARKLPASPIP